MPPSVPVSIAASRPWQHRASPLARAACAAYAVLIAYASLSPWSGWRDLGVSPWAYLTAPLPHYITDFDLAVNVLGYLPFGTLMVAALHPRLRGAAAFALTLAAGALLAGTIEALQTYLPARVASNVDLATNVAGTTLGAALMLPAAEALIDRGRLAQLRARWFTRDSSLLLLLLALWPAAQMVPTPMLFANGQLFDGNALLVALGLDRAAAWQANFGASEFVLAEAVVVTSALLAVGLAAAATMHAAAPRSLLLLALVAAALGARALAYGTVFGPERALLWLTPGAVGGLGLGLLTLLVAAQSRPRALAAGTLAATLLWLAAVNFAPGNPYHADWAARFRPGRLLHLHAVLQWLAAAWPLLLLCALALRPGARRARGGRAEAGGAR